jgi:predicted RNA binding protein with dsRBD fold (UPF0201 family)
MKEIAVRVETEINVTEVNEKVEKAVANIFGHVPPEVKPSYKGSMLNVETKGQEKLIKLRNLLYSDRIRDAARKVFFEGIMGKTISFCLNKQVAFAGHISFSEAEAESPLGPIRVKIECENPRKLIDWLASRTA